MCEHFHFAKYYCQKVVTVILQRNRLDIPQFQEIGEFIE